MPRQKPKSRRQTLHKKHAIEKKIGKHNQKMRRLAKKFPETRKKLKKDPGVPHLFPLKEQLIQKMEEAKRRKEEEKQQMKEARNVQVKKAESGN